MADYSALGAMAGLRAAGTVKLTGPAMPLSLTLIAVELLNDGSQGTEAVKSDELAHATAATSNSPSAVFRTSVEA
jgi:hypothetical protein